MAEILALVAIVLAIAAMNRNGKTTAKLTEEIRRLREELEAMEARGALPPNLRSLKDELARLRLADAQSRAPAEPVAQRAPASKDKAA